MKSPPAILVVDDHAANVDILRTRLLRHGYQVLTASDGEEALAVTRTELPDLILLDLMMPKIDGIEVCRRIKGDPASPFIPIVMITARDGTADLVTALEAGCDEYLTKPVDQVALVARVKSMLRMKELQDKVRDQADRLQTQAAILVEQNRALEHRVNEQLCSVKRAVEIQQALLPKTSPNIAGYEISGRTIPAQIVGGDYFDFIPVDEQRWAFCVGDVSGKGLPAALLMANLQATIRSQASVAPGSTLEGANGLLFRSTDLARYATVFYGALDPATHLVRYANAGHTPPLVVRFDGTVERLVASGTPLGMFDRCNVSEGDVALGPRDLLMLFSDGITEAMDADDCEFGEERLLSVAKENMSLPLEDLADQITIAVKLHARDTTQFDDLTLVLVRRSG